MGSVSLSRRRSRLFRTFLIGSSLVFGSSLLQAQTFPITQCWDRQLSVVGTGAPGGVDLNPGADLYMWNSKPVGGNTQCTLYGMSGGWWGTSTSITFTGAATAQFCKGTPDLNVYCTGTAQGAYSPKGLYLAKYDVGLGAPLWNADLSEPTETIENPIDLDTDASSNAEIAVQVTDTIHSNPYLYFVQVNQTSSSINRYGTDYAMNPSQAVYQNGQWYVTGQDNNAYSEIGGAMWAVYDSSGGRIAQGTQVNYYLDGNGDNVRFNYIIKPASDGSFVVIKNAIYHYVNSTTAPITAHAAFLYNASGTLITYTGAANGQVVNVVNQGSGHPMYFFEYDGTTQTSAGTPMLYQFTDDHFKFNWKDASYGKTIIPDATGALAFGNDPSDIYLHVYRYDLYGHLLTNIPYAGNQSHGINYEVYASTQNQNQDVYVVGVLSNNTGRVVDFRRFVTGCTIASITGPTSVASGGTVTVNVAFTGTTTAMMPIYYYFGPDLTWNGNHTALIYYSPGEKGDSLTLKAAKVTTSTNDVVSGNQNQVERTHTITITP